MANYSKAEAPAIIACLEVAKVGDIKEYTCGDASKGQIQWLKNGWKLDCLCMAINEYHLGDICDPKTGAIIAKPLQTLTKKAKQIVETLIPTLDFMLCIENTAEGATSKAWTFYNNQTIKKGSKLYVEIQLENLTSYEDQTGKLQLVKKSTIKGMTENQYGLHEQNLKVVFGEALNPSTGSVLADLFSLED